MIPGLVRSSGEGTHFSILAWRSPWTEESGGLESMESQRVRHGVTAAAAAKSLQSCPTLCDPIPEILQARTLEWVAISFSNACK